MRKITIAFHRGAFGRIWRPRDLQQFECKFPFTTIFIFAYNVVALRFYCYSKNICTLSSPLRNLDHLKLSLVKPIESGIDFRAIARSNPQLNSICIAECMYCDENREKRQLIEILQMLISAFSLCNSVDFTLISNGGASLTRNEMLDICGSLPCRGVSKNIRIGSTHYYKTDWLWDIEAPFLNLWTIQLLLLFARTKLGWMWY